MPQNLGKIIGSGLIPYLQQSRKSRDDISGDIKRHQLVAKSRDDRLKEFAVMIRDVGDVQRVEMRKRMRNVLQDDGLFEFAAAGNGQRSESGGAVSGEKRKSFVDHGERWKSQFDQLTELVSAMGMQGNNCVIQSFSIEQMSKYIAQWVETV